MYFHLHDQHKVRKHSSLVAVLEVVVPFDGELLVRKGHRTEVEVCCVIVSYSPKGGGHTRVCACAYIESHGIVHSRLVHLTC